MADKKFTPGPWRVENGTTMVWGHCNPDDNSTRGMGYPIAEARINPSGNWSTGPYSDEGEANAHLIAAAPDLYEALAGARDYVAGDLQERKEIYRGYENLGHIDQVERELKAIDAALAKARGEAV